MALRQSRRKNGVLTVAAKLGAAEISDSLAIVHALAHDREGVLRGHAISDRSAGPSIWSPAAELFDGDAHVWKSDALRP